MKTFRARARRRPAASICSTSRVVERDRVPVAVRPALRRRGRPARRHRSGQRRRRCAGRSGARLHVGSVRSVCIAPGVERRVCAHAHCRRSARALQGHARRQRCWHAHGARCHQRRPARIGATVGVCQSEGRRGPALRCQSGASPAEPGTRRRLISEKTSWVAPEIIALGADTVHRFLTESAPLAQRFDFFLNDTLRAAPHTLGDQAETVLADAGTLLQQPGTVRELLADGELPLPTVTLSDGTKVRLDPVRLPEISPVAQPRRSQASIRCVSGAPGTAPEHARRAADSAGDGRCVQRQGAQFRNFARGGAVRRHHAGAVYRTLVDETNAALPSLHRYLRLRKRLLGIHRTAALLRHLSADLDAAAAAAASRWRRLGTHHARGAAAARDRIISTCCAGALPVAG